MKHQWDNTFVTGLVAGLFTPLLTLAGVYLYRFAGQYSLADFFAYLHTMHVFSKLISLSVIPNLLAFFIFIWTHRDQGARGVLGATLIWAFVMLLIKFIL